MSGKVTSGMDSDDDDWSPLVVDVGTGYMKAGFAGDDAPRALFPTVIGKQRFMECMVGMRSDRQYVGDEAHCHRGLVELLHPIEHGVVTDWDSMEKILRHTFYNELRVAPEEHPLLLTEQVLNPTANRERMTQLAFEEFGVPGMYVQNQAVCALYSSGCTTGMVVDVGDGVTQLAPISQGQLMAHAVHRVSLGGQELTHYLARLLNLRGYSFTESGDMATVQDIKEKLGFTALDYDSEMKNATMSSEIEKTYELPDGHVITVANERFRCAEPLFKPAMLGLESAGLPQLVHDCIMKCPPAARRDMFRTIVLSGGGTLSGGFQKRMDAELAALCPDTVKVRTTAPPERKFSAWIGASILGSLSAFRQMWITKAEYDESGPSIVHEKCPLAY